MPLSVDHGRKILLSLLSQIVDEEGTNEQGALRDILTDLRHISSDKKLNFDKALEGSEEVAITEGWLEKKMDVIQVVIEADSGSTQVPFDDFDTIQKAIEGFGYILDKEQSLAQKQTILLIETSEATRVIDKGYVLLNDDYSMDVPS